MSNTSSQNVTEQIPEHNNTPQPKRRFWRKVRMSVLAFLVLFVVFFVWLISTNSGLRFAVLQLPKLGKTHITTRTLSGSILTGFQGDSIRVENEAVNLDISEVAFAWQARELWQRHLHIKDWSIAVFHDIGGTARKFQDISWRHGTGLGLRWFSPIAPFSFDIAYGHHDKRFRWHISLGTRF